MSQTTVIAPNLNTDHYHTLFFQENFDYISNILGENNRNDKREILRFNSNISAAEEKKKPIARLFVNAFQIENYSQDKTKCWYYYFENYQLFAVLINGTLNIQFRYPRVESDIEILCLHGIRDGIFYSQKNELSTSGIFFSPSSEQSKKWCGGLAIIPVGIIFPTGDDEHLDPYSQKMLKQWLIMLTHKLHRYYAK